MPIHLYLAPAAHGKTSYVLGKVREGARGLPSTAIVCVPTSLQARAWHRRLAESGGSIGVRVLIFDSLYVECLDAVGQAYVVLSDPEQYRLISMILHEIPLQHYASLTNRPGFAQSLRDLLGELKAARIAPEAFEEAVRSMGDERRLRELASIYQAYQHRLHALDTADRAGLGWLAVETLENDGGRETFDWPLLVIDGFDNFTQVQIDLLKALAGQVDELIITLTATPDGSPRPLTHRRFDETRLRLETELGLFAESLPTRRPSRCPVLAHLEASLFENNVRQCQSADTVTLVEASDRAAEVRAALRWLKARIVCDGARPGEVAVLMRDLTPYRGFILQTADEFRMPIRLVEGLPLSMSPAIAALIDLLRLILPGDEGEGEPSLPHRLVVEAWRSPYFDWTTLVSENESPTLVISDGDADLLDVASRWGRVIAGLSQWEEALSRLTTFSGSEAADDRKLPSSLPTGPDAEELLSRFRRFVRRITPPELGTCRDYAGWVEDLMGPDPASLEGDVELGRQDTSLNLVARARRANDAQAELDIAALRALKDVLRGMVWVEESLGRAQSSTFSEFFHELAGAVEASSYRPPVHRDREEILVADVVQARGVPFRAVAVMGLSEGEFPMTQAEDPLLRDSDRARLRDEFGLQLEPSTSSSEAGFFYETITRPWERLLLTRPRLADNGAPWEPSPFWEEVRRLVRVEPQRLTSDSVPSTGEVASWAELTQSLVTYSGNSAAWLWAEEENSSRLRQIELSARVFEIRFGQRRDSSFDGNLSDLSGIFKDRFGQDRPWSASRLEAYRTCPFSFFVAYVLGLEPRLEAAEGLDGRQLGNIYHRILERVFRAPSVTDSCALDQLLGALPGVANDVLDDAPEEEAFRETAWWRQTREEIVDNVRRTLQALADLPGDFHPLACEVFFGGRRPLTIARGEDQLRLHGLVDRVDRSANGDLRIIDYKTAGPSSFNKRTLQEGKKLQLPIYALGARDALGLGNPVEGFYWHVLHAKPSDLHLSTFDGGPQGAFDVAVDWIWETVTAIRAGHFAPDPPPEGCPWYCPAATFCWRHRSGFGG